MKYPTKYEECLNTVLSQECIRYNSLITVMLSTLALSIKALKGLVVMSPELDSVCDAIFNNQVRTVPRVRERPPYPHCVRSIPPVFGLSLWRRERKSVRGDIIRGEDGDADDKPIVWVDCSTTRCRRHGPTRPTRP